MKKILVTGSCGFIFSNFVRTYADFGAEYMFASVDKIIAPYNLANIYESSNHKFYMGDIADEQFMNNVFALEKPDFVIHGAAESFVDDSIASAAPFIHSNVVGSQVMVDLSLKHNVKKFLYISTDEVYGQLKPEDKSWTEENTISPRNPYSASKAAGELIVKAAGETHGLNYNITRCSNNYGERQPPRNLIPKVITCLLNNQEIPIHGSGEQFREWLYVKDHCSAVMKVLKNGENKEIYNIGSGLELTNLQVVDSIAKVMKIAPKIKHVKDRPGHDFRYSVNCDKIKQIGWQPYFTNFESCIKMTISWYKENLDFYK